ncbi:killer cell lectin-like receptor subfamily F member 2 [Eptesicus fuscus]|uniref:killer cell lectin-like receptor subfamily F member 2 n=1 Tax=Eptesicus fuscus TaxID=29078 RepID=UPI00101A848C|nr:killer cell lectin-like receptor subfamily F member 2 [Eptesicus fuscus]
MKIFEEMENEDGYMRLNFKDRFKSRQRSKDFALNLHYYGILLAFGSIGILIYLMTVIGLNFSNEKMDFSQNVNISSLAGNNYICPNDWLLNEGKCYKFSTFPKTWNESQRDCSKLQAHLPVIHNLKELEFIQKSLKPGCPSWIGLYVISPGKQWMWINEHPLVELNHFSMIGPTDSMSCAVTTRNQVYSEDCGSKFNGICQRDVS